jgi:hypothetical protein
VVPYHAPRTPVIAPSLDNVGTRTVSVWVYFTDRGFDTDQEFEAALERAENQLLPNARWRRSKVKADRLVSYVDLPVNREFASQVLATGVTKRVVSRYLNAVSVDATMDQIRKISQLPFIRAIDPVAKGYRQEPDVNPNDEHRNPSPNPGTDELDYGQSRPQLAQINVIPAHDAGYSGEGVLLCLLDTGYMLSHEAFDSLRLAAAWDFIHGDSIVWNQVPPDTFTQHNHGTYTLSAAAGLTPGTLYGPAYHASILAGKTETVSYEQPIEEDWYVAGLEWADSLGGEIVSTSLGYTDWYEWSDMDGNTAVTTIGVDIAVANGIVCVTAAGNDRYSHWGHIIAPADADSVIACGAVDIYNYIASFSSPGPSYDGRIKPEVCACGVDTWCATTWSSTSYSGIGGTSLATPLVGGSCALLLEAHPDWTPMMVREALMMTADNATAPNNDYGWGIINVWDAMQYQFSTIPDLEKQPWQSPRLFVVHGSYPNPFNSTVTLDYEIMESGDISLEVFNLLGQSVEKRALGYQPQGRHHVQWSLDPSNASSLYFYKLSHPQGSHWGRWMYMK